MTAAYLRFVVSSDGVYQGHLWGLGDLVDKLIDTQFPENVIVDKCVFRLLLERVTPVCVGRDDTGVYVEVYCCRVRVGLPPDDQTEH